MEVVLDDFREVVLSNATVTTSGSSATFTGFGASQIVLVINVSGTVSGTSPSVTFTLQEVDPGNQTTTIGNSVTGGAITVAGTQILTLPVMKASCVQVTWTVSGTTPSFDGVYATLVNKVAGTHVMYDAAGNGPVAVKPASTAATAADPALAVALSPNSPLPAGTNAIGSVGQGTAAALSGKWPVQVTDGTNTMPTMDAVARAAFHKLTDGANTASVKSTGGLLTASDPQVTTIENAGTITASGSQVITGVGARDVDLVWNIKSSPTGTSPTIQFSLVDVDPVDQTTSAGTAVNSSVISAINAGSVNLSSNSSAVKVSWTVGGTSPSFTNVNLSFVQKNATPSGSGGGGGTVTANQGTPNSLASGWPVEITDGTNILGTSSHPLAVSSSGASDTTATGTLNALNATVQITLAGTAGCGMQLAAGTLIGTIVPEISLDGGTTWNATYFDTLFGGGGFVSSITFASSNTATSASLVSVGGSGLARVRVSAYTSGSASITLRASTQQDASQNFTGTSGGAAPPAAAVVAGLDASSLIQIPRVSKITGQTVEQLSVAATLATPAGAAAGIYALNNPWGSLRAGVDQGDFFNDPFDGATIDNTRWNIPVTSGGGTVTQSNGVLAIATGTTASAYGYLTSLPNFGSRGLVFQAFGTALQLEATILSNTHRFWGIGTVPSAPTASAPLTDGIGFEIDTSGNLNACVWASGTKTFSSTLTKPTDGAYHRYGVAYRADAIYWYLDNLDVPVASSNYALPSRQTLPWQLSVINNTTAPSSAPTFNVQSLGWQDIGGDTKAISDGVQPWRKPRVDRGRLRVQSEESNLFWDDFAYMSTGATALDTTKWTTALHGSASITPNAGGYVELSMASTSGNYGAIYSSQSFGVGIGGGIACHMTVAHQGVVANSYSAWGLAIASGLGFSGPSTGGLVFENRAGVISVDIGTNKYAITYAPTDTNFHEYAIVWRAESVEFYIDDMEKPVFSQTLLTGGYGPGGQFPHGALPAVLFTTPGANSVTANVYMADCQVGELQHSGFQISDPNIPGMRATLTRRQELRNFAESGMCVFSDNFEISPYNASAPYSSLDTKRWTYTASAGTSSSLSSGTFSPTLGTTSGDYFQLQGNLNIGAGGFTAQSPQYALSATIRDGGLSFGCYMSFSNVGAPAQWSFGIGAGQISTSAGLGSTGTGIVFEVVGLNIYASIYNFGGVLCKQLLVKQADNSGHWWEIRINQTQVEWYIDDLLMPVFKYPLGVLAYGLAIKLAVPIFQGINNGTASSAPAMNLTQVLVWLQRDAASLISDPYYQWQRATVHAQGQLAVSNTSRRYLASGRFAKSNITGSTGVQYLGYFLNPSTSNVCCYIKKLHIQSSMAAAVTTKFWYHIARGSFSSPGTAATQSQTYHSSSDAALNLAIYLAPATATLQTDLWVGTPGLLTTAAGSFVPVELLFHGEDGDDSSIVLQPNQGLVLWVDANSASASHSFSIHWAEGPWNQVW